MALTLLHLEQTEDLTHLEMSRLQSFFRKIFYQKLLFLSEYENHLLNYFQIEILLIGSC